MMLFEEVWESLGDGALLETICCQGRALRGHRLTSLPVHSLCFALAVEDVILGGFPC